MLKQNEILLETTDLELAKELAQAKIEGVDISIYQTRAAPVEEIVKFIIEFLSDAGLVYFGHWLGTRNTEKRTKKTTIGKNKIPHTVEDITTLIKKELENIKNDQSKNNE